MFKKLRWGRKGSKIDGSFLNQSRFADDIVLSNPDELARTVEELNHASKETGLKMNIQKYNLMSHENIDVTIDNKKLENFTHYIYLEYNITPGEGNQRAEITKRIAFTWATFGKLAHDHKTPEITINPKRKPYNICVLPFTTYGMETMILTVQSANRL